MWVSTSRCDQKCRCWVFACRVPLPQLIASVLCASGPHTCKLESGSTRTSGASGATQPMQMGCIAVMPPENSGAGLIHPPLNMHEVIFPGFPLCHTSPVVRRSTMFWNCGKSKTKCPPQASTVEGMGSFFWRRFDSSITATVLFALVWRKANGRLPRLTFQLAWLQSTPTVTPPKKKPGR